MLPAVQQPAQAPPPQLQVPPEHVAPDAHALQAAPPVPHCVLDCDAADTHVPPLQHPLGQEVASHTHAPVDRSHSCPEPHPMHVTPPVPHAAVDCDPYGTHRPAVPPLQQPSGQLFWSHEQVPAVVSHSPVGQEPHAAPPAPHSTADCEAKGTHRPAPLQQPVAHVAALHGVPASASGEPSVDESCAVASPLLWSVVESLTDPS